MIEVYFLRVAFWAALALAVLSLPHHAHAAAPADVQSACTGDAVRLCPMSAVMKCAAGKCADIDLCLRAHGRQVSGECRAAIRRWNERQGREK